MTITTHTHITGEQGSEQDSASTNVATNYEQIADLVKTQYGGMLSLVRRKLRDRELAADLVNEAIAVTLEHVKTGRLTQHERIGGYVFKVCMNLLRNYQRNSDNRQELRTNAELLDTLATYDKDDIEAAQIRQKAQQVIEALSSSRDREVIKRFYLDEDDKQVICAALDLTPLQFTQIMSRARQRMRMVFESQGVKKSDLVSLFLLLVLT